MHAQASRLAARVRGASATGMVVVTAAVMLPLLAPLATLRGHDATQPGALRVAEYTLPATALASFAGHRGAGARLPRHEAAQAEAAPWTGPRQIARQDLNPLNLVVHVTGTARERGDVRSLWQAGWQEDHVGSRRWVVPLEGLARANVEAGTRLSIRAASGPISFRDARAVMPYLGLVQMTNFDVSEVRVEVWSGAAPLRWAGAGIAAAAAGLLGLAAWGWRRRRAAIDAADAAIDVPSTRPSAEGVVAALMPPAADKPPLPASADMPPLPASADKPPLPASAGKPPGTAARSRAIALDVPLDTLPALPHDERVFAALREVLTSGLAVASVPDLERVPRKRRR